MHFLLKISLLQGVALIKKTQTFFAHVSDKNQTFVKKNKNKKFRPRQRKNAIEVLTFFSLGSLTFHEGFLQTSQNFSAVPRSEDKFVNFVNELPEIWNLSKHLTNLKNNEDSFFCIFTLFMTIFHFFRRFFFVYL